MTPATILDHDGIRQSITEWALDYGITPGIIIGRLERGEPVADAITKPMKVGHRGQRLPILNRKPHIHPIANGDRIASGPKLHVYGDRALSIKEWSALTGLPSGTITMRLHKGWTIERAVTTPPNPKKCRPGVVFNYSAFEGTGAGSTAQENSNITFSGIDA